MKKHKILEKAMHDFPAGQKFTSTVGAIGTSTGIFEFAHGNLVTKTVEGDMVYIYEKGVAWAKPVAGQKYKIVMKDGRIQFVPATDPEPEKEFFKMEVKGGVLHFDAVTDPQPGDGLIFEQAPKPEEESTVLIRVENEKEFKLLMAYFESKGWTWKTGKEPLGWPYNTYCRNIEFKDGFTAKVDAQCQDLMVTLYQDFAKENGLPTEEQDKVKEVIVQLGNQRKAIVRPNVIMIQTIGGTHLFQLYPSEIEDIFHYLKELTDQL